MSNPNINPQPKRIFFSSGSGGSKRYAGEALGLSAALDHAANLFWSIRATKDAYELRRAPAPFRHEADKRNNACRNGE